MSSNIVILEDLLSRFTIDLDIDAAKADKEKNYFVKFNDEITFFVKGGKEQIYIYATIINCPQENHEDLFSYLMAANLLGQGTGNNVISLDPSGKFLTLSSLLPYEVNFKEFKESIEDFINYLIYWKKEIENIKQRIKLY